MTYIRRELSGLAKEALDSLPVVVITGLRQSGKTTLLRTAQILNQSELARDVKLPVSTVTRHLGLLETSMILDHIAPCLTSRTTRLIKSPKIFVSDSGIACHLTGVNDLSAGVEEPLRGALYETYVHQNLSGILAARLPSYELGFWSVQGRYEVDFVISRGREVVAVEVKAGSRFRERDLNGLQAFIRKNPRLRAAVLAYNGTETVKLGDRLYAIPLGTLLT